MLAVSCCQRSLAHTIHSPVSMRNRKSQPKSPVTRWDMPNGVQWRLCWAANSSGSGAGGGGATSMTHASKSFSSCTVHLFFQRWAVLFGAARRRVPHGPETIVGTQPFRAHKGRLTEQPVHTVEIVPKPEQEFAVQFEVEPGAVAGRHRAREEFVEAPSVRSGRSEERRVGKECRSRWSP